MLFLNVFFSFFTELLTVEDYMLKILISQIYLFIMVLADLQTITKTWSNVMRGYNLYIKVNKHVLATRKLSSVEGPQLVCQYACFSLEYGKWSVFRFVCEGIEGVTRCGPC